MPKGYLDISNKPFTFRINDKQVLYPSTVALVRRALGLCAAYQRQGRSWSQGGYTTGLTGRRDPEQHRRRRIM